MPTRLGPLREGAENLLENCAGAVAGETVLIVHEDTRTGGFGGELAALIAEEAFEHLDGPVRRLTGPDVPAMPFAKPLEEAFMLNPTKIAEAMRDLAKY